MRLSFAPGLRHELRTVTGIPMPPKGIFVHSYKWPKDLIKLAKLQKTNNNVAVNNFVGSVDFVDQMPRSKGG
jgi:hypothetical protein